jgi:hypothetical protein
MAIFFLKFVMKWLEQADVEDQKRHCPKEHYQTKSVKNKMAVEILLSDIGAKEAVMPLTS